MAPRSIWNGTLTFGMVRVPIKLYSAIEPKGIGFREIHTKDESTLRHRRVCKSEGSVVDKDEIGKGYEVSSGDFVLLEADEIKAAAGDGAKTIEIEEFVDVNAIDPFHFNKTYFLGCRDDAGPFSVFSAALDKTGKAGIGRFTFHNREYLVAVRAYEDRLALHTLRFADEIVPPDDLEMPNGGKPPTTKEVKMARALISGLTEDFEPGDFQDEYRSAVMELIERKAEGKKPRKKKPKTRKSTDNLSKALEESLAAQGTGR